MCHSFTGCSHFFLHVVRPHHLHLAARRPVAARALVFVVHATPLSIEGLIFPVVPSLRALLGVSPARTTAHTTVVTASATLVVAARTAIAVVGWAGMTVTRRTTRPAAFAQMSYVVPAGAIYTSI